MIRPATKNNVAGRDWRHSFVLRTCGGRDLADPIKRKRTATDSNAGR
jgi:hypothetical protein